jgi:hypothetical protein
MVIQSDFTISLNSFILQFHQTDFQLSVRISRKTERTFQNQPYMSDSLSFGCVVCNSEVEFTWMNHCSSSHRNDIHGWCYDSGVKIKSFPKISEKSLNSTTMNFSNYVNCWILYKWMARQP